MKKNKLQAIALQYDGITVPKVTAKGEGLLAKQIIAKAHQFGIPIERDEELTSLLSKVRINEEIPAPLYTAVAQVLAFLYYVNDHKSKD